MNRSFPAAAIALASLLSLAARAEPAHHMHALPEPAGMSAGMATEHRGQADTRPAEVLPTEPGQAAFAAIQEIVSLLDANPHTDWSKVDIDALRRHLADMDNVTLRSQAVAAPVDGGMRFTVTGEGAVRDAIRHMVTAHAHTMDGYKGWRYAAADVPDGAVLTVRVPPADMAKLRGLGFFGVMAYGMHHQRHHLMIASGMSPHR